MMIRDIKYTGLPFVIPYLHCIEKQIVTHFTERGVLIPPLSVMGGGVTWYLFAHNFAMEIDHIIHGNISIEIFAGSQTDWGSVPKMLRSFIDNDDAELLIAFLVHDKLFQTHFFGDGKNAMVSANEFFDDIMAWFKVTKVKRELVFESVQKFGLPAYAKREKRDAPQYQKCRITIIAKEL
jgi:hypothetical protein